jgi:Fe-S-cluster-containing hydrogenase component 2
MLRTKPSLCTECRICELICAFHHFGENNPRRARLRISSDWPESPRMSVCRGCKDHECVAACPHQALSFQDWVRLDQERCDGCGACVEACPVDGIRLDPKDNLPLVCDTCQGQYMCAAWCPTGAVERMTGS